MKSKIYGLLFVPAFFISCSEQKSNPSSDSDVDAARNFIRASLNNDFREAQAYLLPDSANAELLRLAEERRATLSREENINYRQSSIVIYDTRKIDDSTSIITYDNSYKKAKNDLRVVRRNGQWLVDLKYTLLRSDSTGKR
ncbi:hypothetical protein EPD60_14115 [Flaviaesturariibacter flavus]|uniref:Uncharacterized protein n=1 Tax=Flaviaesturariibacter flavus TaxID=2502780 RepID=A0A4R1B7C5_9BACT|nr:DUF4878 domain-containing protein [Flaviaesturariibacter flavus]TCJ12408.1 hypothetical protein EPD60_14115 [Flaviaesturariibacter flavus]